MAPPKTSLTREGKVRLIMPGGDIIAVSPESVAAQLKIGARYESPQEAISSAERGQLERDFGGTAETVRAFGEGGLDVLIPGASGFLSDDAKYRAEVNPTARGLGSLTGLATGLLAGGPLGGAAGLSVKGGAKAAGLIRGGGTTAKLARGALAGGIETGLFAVGQEITDASLYDKPLTAESLASGFFSGAGLGVIAGGIGAGVPLVGKALQRRKLAKQSAKLFAGTSEASQIAKARVVDHFDNLSGLGKHLGAKNLALASDDFFKVVRSGNLDDITKLGKDLETHKNKLMNFANIKGDQKALDAVVNEFDEFVNTMKMGIDDVVGKKGAFDATDIVALAEAVDLAGGNIIPDEKVLGETGSAILKVALLGRAITKGRQGTGFLGSLFKTAVQGHARGTAFSMASKRGLSAGGQLAVAGVAGKVAGKQADAILTGDIANLIKVQQRAQGRIGRAVTRFGKGVVGKAQVPLAIHKALKGIMTPDEISNIRSEKNEAKKFLQTMDVLKRLNQNPNELATRAEELSAPIGSLNPELGGLLRQNIIADAQFLAEKAPVNPGNMLTFAGDRWMPTPLDMEKFSRYVRAINDPGSIIERAASGRMTPEEAEVLKKRRPAYFAEMQRRLLDNPEKLKDMPYGVRINLGLLFEVQTDPTMGIMDSSQAHFAMLSERSAEIQAGAAPDSPKTGLNQPTKAQELTGR